MRRCFRNWSNCKIHINGDYIVGNYSKEDDAAIAYNKAVDILEKKGLTINYNKNYIDGIDEKEYKDRYNTIKISKNLINFVLV